MIAEEKQKNQISNFKTKLAKVASSTSLTGTLEIDFKQGKFDHRILRIACYYNSTRTGYNKNC